MDSIKNIYYRGRIDFCNYNCYYCPFSKNKYNGKVLKEDELYLECLYEYIIKNSTENIFFLPYGEWMVHRYFLEYISKISKIKSIKEIGIQTNGSFSIDILKEIFDKDNGSLDKLNLWISYHPKEIDRDIFLKKINILKENNIKFTVGTVANIIEKENILYLKENLPEEIYFWLNEMDGRKIPYKKEDIDFFKSIDPYFLLELKNSKSSVENCIGGVDRIFLDYNLDKKLCNISKAKVKDNRICKSNICNCYLSYSNRTDIKLLERYEKNGLYRYLKKVDGNILFFDIDNSLIVDNNISHSLKLILKKLSKENILFLNTSLPYKIAKKKLKDIFYIFNGGIFSNGGDIRFFDYDYNLDFTVEEDTIKGIYKNREKIYIDKENKNIYKIMIFFKEYSKLKENDKKILQEKYNISKDNRYIYLNNIFTNKEKAIEIVKRFYLKNWKDVYFFGDSENDIINKLYFKTSRVNKNLEKILKKLILEEKKMELKLYTMDV